MHAPESMSLSWFFVSINVTFPTLFFLPVPLAIGNGDLIVNAEIIHTWFIKSAVQTIYGDSKQNMNVAQIYG